MAFFILFVTLPVAIQAQYDILDTSDFVFLTNLPEQLPEVSGIIVTPYNTVIGHNDKGHKARLYEFDLKNGNKIRTIEIDHASNRDWEDIAIDSKYIYIADVGNNRGKREKLKIYRIEIPEKGDKRISVEAEKIRFRYADQTDFEKRKSHNYDCEAIITVGDSLYLFTKNRGDGRTNVLAMSKEPGEYILRVTQSFDSDGLITGADIVGTGKNRMLSLVGYNKANGKYKPFIWMFTGFSGNKYFSGSSKRLDLPLHIQVEGVHFLTNKKLLISNEEEEGKIKAMLHVVKVKALMGG